MSFASVFFDFFAQHNQAVHLCESVQRDIWNIAAIVTRLDMNRNDLYQNEEIIDFWGKHAALDIELIYFEYRSICDYLSQLLGAVFPEIPESKAESLYKLIRWVFQNQLSAPSEIVSLFNENQILVDDKRILSTWFGHMRAIRDDISHKGQFPVVYGGPDQGILFQVLSSDNLKTVIPNLPHIKFNDNVVFFDKYFALQFAHLIIFIESVSELIIRKFGFEDKHFSSTGFTEIFQWVNGFHHELTIEQ